VWTVSAPIARKAFTVSSRLALRMAVAARHSSEEASLVASANLSRPVPGSRTTMEQPPRSFAARLGSLLNYYHREAA